MRGLDKDCDSTIDIQEFASRFAPVFTRLNMKQDVSALFTTTIIRGSLHGNFDEWGYVHGVGRCNNIWFGHDYCVWLGCSIYFFI